jgi:hypothetical protein
MLVTNNVRSIKMQTKELLNESMEDLINNNFDSSIIVDNKIVFVIEEKLFRVRMPIQSEQALTEHKRNLAQLQYMQAEGCITKKQLIAQLKESGVVDIEKLDESREELIKELKKFWFILAPKDSSDKLKIFEYSKKIKEIQDNLKQLAIDISTYLSPTLESRLEKFYVEYITFLCTEKQEGNEWIKLWESFEDFNKADTSLTNKSISSMTWLLLNKH